jgi:hypothetical protein
MVSHMPKCWHFESCPFVEGENLLTLCMYMNTYSLVQQSHICSYNYYIKKCNAISIQTFALVKTACLTERIQTRLHQTHACDAFSDLTCALDDFARRKILELYV